MIGLFYIASAYPASPLRKVQGRTHIAEGLSY